MEAYVGVPDFYTDLVAVLVGAKIGIISGIVLSALSRRGYLDWIDKHILDQEGLGTLLTLLLMFAPVFWAGFQLEHRYQFVSGLRLKPDETVVDRIVIVGKYVLGMIGLTGAFIMGLIVTDRVIAWGEKSRKRRGKLTLYNLYNMK